MIGDGIMSDLIRMRLYWRNQCWKEHSVLYDVTVTVLKEWIPMQEDSEQLWWLYNRYYVFGQSINYCTKGNTPLFSANVRKCYRERGA